MQNWRAQFNESELAQIDAAPPTSLLSRMAVLLDRCEGAGNGRRIKTFEESGESKWKTDYKSN